MVTINRKKAALLAKGEVIDSKEDLITKLQMALMIEFSTIPPYLTAMYSLQDNTCYAYQLVRSVVLEEMLHMNLVCNLLNGIGAKPAFSKNPYFPKFPCGLPGQKPGEGPLLQLMPASTALFENTFMAIEAPARRDAEPEESDYQTIAQFYDALRVGFEDVEKKIGHAALFTDTGFQKTDTYFGSGGGKVIYVKDLESAKLAITEIVEQGEGTPASDSPTIPTEPFGLYDGYGNRKDGTFGPLVRSTEEMAHYYKFAAVANGTYPLGAVYPMMPNPSVKSIENPTAKSLAEILDGCYGIMVRGLETAFSSNAEPDPFFTVVFAMMQGVIPSLSVSLMQLPSGKLIDPGVGPNAGPTFHYADMSLDDILKKVDSMQSDALAGDGLVDIRQTLNHLQKSLLAIKEKTKGFKVSYL